MGDGWIGGFTIPSEHRVEAFLRVDFETQRARLHPDADEVPVTLAGATSRGRTVTFEIVHGRDKFTFEGTVDGERLQGMARHGAGSGTFELTRTMQVDPSAVYSRFAGTYALGDNRRLYIRGKKQLLLFDAARESLALGDGSREVGL